MRSGAFALFGILVVNIGVFASPYYGSGVVDPAFGRPLDLAASWVFGLLFETKFYLLFSFLFGYSFTLQMAAAERGQAAFLPRFLRRLAGPGRAGRGACRAVLSRRHPADLRHPGPAAALLSQP